MCAYIYIHIVRASELVNTTRLNPYDWPLFFRRQGYIHIFLLPHNERLISRTVILVIGLITTFAVRRFTVERRAFDRTGKSNCHCPGSNAKCDLTLFYKRVRRSYTRRYTISRAALHDAQYDVQRTHIISVQIQDIWCPGLIKMLWSF